MTLSVINNTISSGPSITYPDNSTIVTNGDIYTDIRDSSSPVHLSSTDDSLLNWSLVGDAGSYTINNNESPVSSVYIYSMGDVGYIEPRDITVRATNPSDGSYSDVIIHFGTGYQCQDGSWAADFDSCPILTEE